MKPIILSLIAATLVSGCMGGNPHAGGFNKPYNDKAGPWTKITESSACDYAKNIYRYIGGLNTKSTRDVMAVNSQFLQQEHGWTDQDIKDLYNGTLRIGQDIDKAVCIQQAYLVNHSAGVGYSQKQYKYSGFNYFYEQNNSGVVDAFN